MILSIKIITYANIILKALNYLIIYGTQIFNLSLVITGILIITFIEGKILDFVLEFFN